MQSLQKARETTDFEERELTWSAACDLSQRRQREHNLERRYHQTSGSHFRKC